LQKVFEKTPEGVFRDYSLKINNTWYVGGKASYAYFPESRNSLIDFFRKSFFEETPWSVLGGGSNVLISDRGFPGCIVFTEKLNKMVLLPSSSPEKECIYADAGVSLAHLLKFSLHHSLSGLEFGIGIPGSLGGALMGNAGTQGQCIGNLVEYVDLLFSDARVRRIATKEILWKYRFSSLSEIPCILLGCVLAFRKETKEVLKKNLRFFAAKRKGQPFLRRTAGSVFKNPEGNFAGKLLDASGCKGIICGGARVSLEHANFIENYHEASSQDILELIYLCREKVKEHTGISLYPEVRFVGFEDSEILFT